MSRATVVGVIGVLVIVAAFVALNRQPSLRTPETVPAVDPSSVYDPYRAGEELPSGYRQLLPRDAIRPVYQPVFVPASQAGWDDEDLVIGLEVDGEAKAYPVGFLNRREMVVDSVAGIPVLVTW